jgi:uncharacterized protein DUF2442
VRLADGRVLHVPLSWFDLLAMAPATVLRRVELTFRGQFIHFPGVDETISVARLVAPACPVCLEREWQEHDAGAVLSERAPARARKLGPGTKSRRSGA